MKKYWVYIVDNSQRDLSCIAWWIFNSGHHNNQKVCLLPASELQSDFFVSERPDVIVWNYARPNNIDAIKYAKWLNIYNIIHDTEGIPYDLNTYFSGLDNNDIALERVMSQYHSKSTVTITGNRIFLCEKTPPLC